jgi:DNA-binding NarL/FixJ family response regulator
MQFLLIEDSNTIRGGLRQSLTKAYPDAVIREASEGRAAIHELTQGKVDLIITDLQMPGMDGERFLQVLKGNPLLRKKSVLVYSSSITPELRAGFSGIAHVDFLDKNGATAETVMERVAALINLNAVAAAKPAP